ncbi:MAG: CHAT domain-containing protein, partial [Bacteroidales bacterium]|nr:CHAT domain-containing protein [Bacteroidales bacterium]
ENEFETFSNALQTSYELYKLTNEQESLAKAFNFSESSKSAVLNETMKNISALNIGGIPDSLINKEKQLEKNIWTYEELIYEENKKKTPNKNKLGYWNKYLFEEKQEYSDLLNYLENNFKEYLSLKHQSNTISLEDLQASISRKESIVEFFLSDENLYTFLIQKNNLFFYRTDIDSVFNNHLSIVLESISNNNFSHHGYNEFAKFQKSSFYIYTKIFQDIEDKIINSDLIIIPDGTLAYLPFEVLTTENKNFPHINYKKLSYFLYSNTISYSHSASFILNNKNYAKTAEKSIGAFAPSYDNLNNLYEDLFPTRQQYREKLFPLKGIKEEVLKVTELIDGDKYLDMEASEKKFKEVAHTYDILHLAMHTIINDQNPMYSK